MLWRRSLKKAVRLSFLSSLMALVAFAAAPAFAAKRVALIVGNSAYRNVAHLDNPINDAKLMAKTLRDLGFTLVGEDAQLDLDKPHFDAALQDFSNQVLGSEVALFYYAGHGVQVGGRNFLVPVEANPAKESDVYLQMVDTSIVLTQMEGSGAKLKIVLLDACRNNPFTGRGLRATGGGLAQMQAPEGTLISYATQPGAVALDGSNGDSPYSKALAEAIRKPGVGLFDTFNDVGLAVKRATGGQQQPWLASSPIEGGFSFMGGQPAVVVSSAEPVATNPSGADASKRTTETAAAPPKAEASQGAASPAAPAPKPAAVQPAPPPPKPVAPSQTAALIPNESPPKGADVESPVATCDRLASSPIDPGRPSGIAGVEYEDIVAAPAIAACRAAMAAEPRNTRLWFELGRSEMKAGGADDEAISLFRKAAAEGHSGAMNSLGLAYERGVGVRKDMGEAARWYQRSAEAGNSAAMHRLGMAFKNGDGAPKNWVQALRWFRKSADAGNVIGMTDLGRAYAEGWGTAPNPVEAAKWFRKAAEAGGAAAMNQLGVVYMRGFGVERDPAAAVLWFRKSADAGNIIAMENLGRAYRNGVGVHRDEDEAKRWFEKARR
jgi:TPR repeat protein